MYIVFFSILTHKFARPFTNYSYAMRVSFSVLFTLVGTTLLTARGIPTSSTKSYPTKNKAQARALRETLVTLRDEEKNGFLSIPQDDPDPAGRSLRLSYRAPFWEFTSYGSIDPELANLTMAAPAGFLGDTALASQGATVTGQLGVSVETGTNVLATPIGAACFSINGTGDCLEHLDSYLPLYGALAPEYQPAAYTFYDSDYAFARERITSSPAFITRVNSLGDIPFSQADVTGYDLITGGIPLAKLVAQGRVFIVDFYPLYEKGLLEASPNSFLEAPTAVFFLNGPVKAKRNGAPKRNARTFKNGPILMPLAIKYNVQQNYVVSPKDPHADWFLAKAVFNCLDRDVNAIYHFVLHTAISNVAIAAQKHFASEHPLFQPIQHASAENFGIIFAGVAQLLRTDGSFDTYLSISGSSIKSLLFPYFMQQFDWRLTNLQENLKARGVADIPGFLYRDDGAALYDALYKYANKYLAGSYRKSNSVTNDPELQGFLAALTNSSNSIAYLNGFPSGDDVTSLQDVSALLAQILWITGVGHHALNSFRILNFDLVYPSHPGKILDLLPASKGTLTDDQVQQDYISGAGFSPAQVTSTDHFTPDLTTLSIGNPLSFFIGTQGLAFAFYPLLQKPSRLTNIYLSDTENLKTAKAAIVLRRNLRAISARIIKREAGNNNSPKYLLLDPASLPFNLYI